MLLQWDRLPFLSLIPFVRGAHRKLFYMFHYKDIHTDTHKHNARGTLTLLTPALCKMYTSPSRTNAPSITRQFCFYRCQGRGCHLISSQVDLVTRDENTLRDDAPRPRCWDENSLWWDLLGFYSHSRSGPHWTEIKMRFLWSLFSFTEGSGSNVWECCSSGQHLLENIFFLTSPPQFSQALWI